MGYSQMSSDESVGTEVPSGRSYPNNYKPLPLDAQVQRLKEFFPELVCDKIRDPGKLPTGAEAFFALPNIWQREQSASTYRENVSKVLELNSQARGGAFFNPHEEQLKRTCLEQTFFTEAGMIELSTNQGHPSILVIAAQFGLKHRGCSANSAQNACGINEFGLDVFATGVMLLTHPERLQNDSDLWIDCSGNIYRKQGGNPFVSVFNGELVFDKGSSSFDNESFGSVTGFVLK